MKINIPDRSSEELNEFWAKEQKEVTIKDIKKMYFSSTDSFRHHVKYQQKIKGAKPFHDLKDMIKLGHFRLQLTKE